MPRAQGHCLFLREPRFLQGKLRRLYLSSKHSFVEVSALVPQPHPQSWRWFSAAPWAAVPARASPGPLSPLPGPAQARPQAACTSNPGAGCAPTSCLGALVCCHCCPRDHPLSRSSSLASNATSSRKSSEADAQAWPSASCWRLPAHHSAPPSHPGPGSVSLPTWRPWRKLLTETKD